MLYRNKRPNPKLQKPRKNDKRYPKKAREKSNFYFMTISEYVVLVKPYTFPYQCNFQKNNWIKTLIDKGLKVH